MTAWLSERLRRERLRQKEGGWHGGLVRVERSRRKEYGVCDVYAWNEI